MVDGLLLLVEVVILQYATEDNLKRNEFLALTVWCLFLLVILFAVTSFVGCDSGWTVAGWDV